jgi:hypothetical protein
MVCSNFKNVLKVEKIKAIDFSCLIVSQYFFDPQATRNGYFSNNHKFTSILVLVVATTFQNDLLTF